VFGKLSLALTNQVNDALVNVGVFPPCGRSLAIGDDSQLHECEEGGGEVSLHSRRVARFRISGSARDGSAGRSRAKLCYRVHPMRDAYPPQWPARQTHRRLWRRLDTLPFARCALLPPVPEVRVLDTCDKNRVVSSAKRLATLTKRTRMLDM
jgi:hypothetical protein